MPTQSTGTLLLLMALFSSTASAEQLCGGLPADEQVGLIEDDVVVTGGICQLVDAIVRGGVTVEAGGTLEAEQVVIERDLVIESGRQELKATLVNGNVTVGPGGRLRVAEGSRVGGDVAVEGCFEIFDGIVGGSIEVEGGALGGNRDTTVGGDVTITGSQTGQCAVDVTNLTHVDVRGDLTVQGGTQGFVFKNARIDGDLAMRQIELSGSTPAALLSTNVGGTVQITAVRGAVFTIGFNSIVGDLECQDIDPPPMSLGQSRVIGDKRGQCSKEAGF